MGINESSAIYGICSRTLRRKSLQRTKADLPLGPLHILGIENEK